MNLSRFLHRVNQEFVEVARRWSPRVLTDPLRHVGPQLDQFWASLDMDRLGAAVSGAAPGVPAPAWLDTFVRAVPYALRRVLTLVAIIR